MDCIQKKSTCFFFYFSKYDKQCVRAHGVLTHDSGCHSFILYKHVNKNTHYLKFQIINDNNRYVIFKYCYFFFLWFMDATLSWKQKARQKI